MAAESQLTEKQTLCARHGVERKRPDMSFACASSEGSYIALASRTARQPAAPKPYSSAVRPRRQRRCCATLKIGILTASISDFLFPSWNGASWPGQIAGLVPLWMWRITGVSNPDKENRHSPEHVFRGLKATQIQDEGSLGWGDVTTQSLHS